MRVRGEREGEEEGRRGKGEGGREGDAGGIPVDSATTVVL